MNRHKHHPWNEVVERMCDDSNKEEDLGRLITLLHRYGDYFLVEAVKNSFERPEQLLDGGSLDTYSRRLILLEAIGFFNKHECVLNNLRTLNRLRNIYAHDVMIPDEPPEYVTDLIRTMKPIDLKGNECRPDVPWKNFEDEYLARVHICATDSLGFVQLATEGWFKGKRRAKRARTRS